MHIYIIISECVLGIYNRVDRVVELPCGRSVADILSSP